MDLEWWNKHSNPAPPTEIGFATIYGQQIIDFCKDGGASLEDLLAKIRAGHLRITETAHMINQGEWLREKTEENFLFGETCFVSAQVAKEVLATLLTESTWQEGDERRPIILVGQGLGADMNILRKSWKLDLHKTQAVDILQGKYIATDAGITTTGWQTTSMKALMDGFGLTPVDDFWTHNGGNDAVVILLLTLLAGLNDRLHPESAGVPGWPSNLVNGRHIYDIIVGATPQIRANCLTTAGALVFCHRCSSKEHTADACSTQFPACPKCGSTDHLEERCVEDLLREPCERCGALDHEIKYCRASEKAVSSPEQPDTWPRCTMS